MKNKATTSPSRRRLKEKTTQKTKQLSAEETARLLHELEVHQIELEAQNEELRKARSELESFLTRYTELYDFAPLGYTTLTQEGIIQEINFAAAKLLGYDRSRLINRRFAQFVSGRSRLAFDKFFTEVLSSVGQGTKTCEAALYRGDDERRFVRFTSSTLLKGQSLEILLALEDITERKQVEEERREANKRKDEFLALLSHELRNPIAPISTSLVVLERTAPGGERARKAMEIIGRQVKHLTRLVDDLLDIGRIERGQLHLQRSRMELGEAVRRVMEDHLASFEESLIRLEGRFQAGPFWLDADPTRIAQIIGNLLTNALKFTPPGGKVEVLLEQRGSFVAVLVRDNGVGLEADILTHLFEPFIQAPQPIDRPAGGLGLGLSMVKALAGLHGGTVSASSDGLGRGTEIKVLLPLNSAKEVALPAVRPLSHHHYKALVIEDNIDAAESMKMAIELLGHEVKVAYDSKTGLALTKEFKPEIVICDIGLPEIDGYTVAKSIRSDLHSDAYLVALSGYARPSDVQRAMDAGFNQHIAKPISGEKLARLFAPQSPT